MEKPKPKRIYWRADIKNCTREASHRLNSSELADAWRKSGWVITRITVYSARELREWERQREAEIRREERERIADWLKKECGFNLTANLIRRGDT